MFQLTVSPARAIADQPVHIHVTGLLPSQLVTFNLSLKDEKGNLFQSRAFYKANGVGEVDLDRDPALGGDYVGVHPMGLFWSLKPEKMFQRLRKLDVMNSPFWLTLDLYDSCLKDKDRGRPRASQTIERWFSCPGMQRVPIREGQIRGVLFLPPGKGPFPGVIDLFGAIGGLVESRASLLATHGFAVLALAYFAYEDLPPTLMEVDLEYFEEAANFLLAHSKVQQPGIGVISVSKGAEIALAMNCYLKQVVATVCINGPAIVSGVPLRYKDVVVTPVKFKKELIQFHTTGTIIYRYILDDLLDQQNQQSMLPVEKIQSHILYVVGEDDGCMDSRKQAEYVLDQLQRQGRNNGRILLYPGAGHLIEPPYAPLCFASRNPGTVQPVFWGGDFVLHAAAQEHAWGEIKKFLSQHLAVSRNKL